VPDTNKLFTKTDSLPDFHQKCWDQLQRACVDKKHPMREIVMGTTSLDAGIDQRMVVLRLAERSSLTLTSFTDLRAQKVLQLQQYPQLHYLAWHPKLRLQLRFKGEASLHHEDEVARSAWQKLSYYARTLYSAQTPPGQPVPDTQVANAAYAHPDGVNSDQWFANFVVVRSQITEMEGLVLGREKQLRARYTYTHDEMQAQWLVP